MVVVLVGEKGARERSHRFLVLEIELALRGLSCSLVEIFPYESTRIASAEVARPRASWFEIDCSGLPGA